MVDIADLGQVNALYTEAATIDQAFANFQRNGTITQMTISAWPLEGEVPDDAPPSSGNALIDTSHITYPPQMKDAIIQQLRDRRSAIDQELEGLGVTGLGPPPASPDQQPQPQQPQQQEAQQQPQQQEARATGQRPRPAQP